MVSIGTISGGTRYNIIPDGVGMTGTIRSYEDQVRKGVHEKVRRTVAGIAESAGAKAEVTIIEKYDPTINDEALTELMLPTLRWAANGDVVRSPLVARPRTSPSLPSKRPVCSSFSGLPRAIRTWPRQPRTTARSSLWTSAALIVGRARPGWLGGRFSLDRTQFSVARGVWGT